MDVANWQYVIDSSGNGTPPIRYQVIAWTNVGLDSYGVLKHGHIEWLSLHMQYVLMQYTRGQTQSRLPMELSGMNYRMTYFYVIQLLSMMLVLNA